MSFRQMNLNVFANQPNPHVLFQPRVEPWFDWHRIFNTMPSRYQGMDVQAFYDDLDLSMRYVDYYTGMPRPIRREFAPQAKVHETLSEEWGTRVYETPYGELVEGLEFTVDETWRTVDFAVKDRDDLKKLRWLYQHMAETFSLADFEQGDAFIGERGVPQFYLPKSPYLALALNWMKLTDFIYALADYPDEIHETMRVIDDSYDRLYEEVIGCGCVQIVNFGENVHEQHMSPCYFERYLIPFYEKRCAQLHQAGIYTHIHIDGYFKHLLPYFKDLPFDGLEALTPEPQGDVSLEAIKEHIGDKVLLDGIPAVYFLPTYSRELLMEMVEKLVDYFHPRLILGVSDEVPEGADEEAIERVRMISEWCRAHPTGGTGELLVPTLRVGTPPWALCALSSSTRKHPCDAK